MDGTGHMIGSSSIPGRRDPGFSPVKSRSPITTKVRRAIQRFFLPIEPDHQDMQRARLRDVRESHPAAFLDRNGSRIKGIILQQVV